MSRMTPTPLSESERAAKGAGANLMSLEAQSVQEFTTATVTVLSPSATGKSAQVQYRVQRAYE
jgi:hypothetical protein